MSFTDLMTLLNVVQSFTLRARVDVNSKKLEDGMIFPTVGREVVDEKFCYLRTNTDAHGPTRWHGIEYAADAPGLYFVLSLYRGSLFQTLFYFTSRIWAAG